MNTENIFCPKCGSNQKGNSFCSKCGNQLITEEQKKDSDLTSRSFKEKKGEVTEDKNSSDSDTTKAIKEKQIEVSKNKDESNSDMTSKSKISIVLIIKNLFHLSIVFYFSNILYYFIIDRPTIIKGAEVVARSNYAIEIGLTYSELLSGLQDTNIFNPFLSLAYATGNTYMLIWSLITCLCFIIYKYKKNKSSLKFQLENSLTKKDVEQIKESKAVNSLLSDYNQLFTEDYKSDPESDIKKES